MANALVLSHNNLCKEIKFKLSSPSMLKDACDNFKDWIKGERRWENVQSINDLLSLLVRAKLFGTFQINSLIAFKKLVNDLEFDEMVLEHLKLIEQFPDNKVPVNQYALSRKSNSSNTNSTHPKNNECETKIEIISIIMKHITLIQDIKSLGRHLGLNTAELKRITTKNDLESIMVQMILEKYWNDEKFSLATLINVLNDDLNRRDVTQLIEKLLNKN